MPPTTVTIKGHKESVVLRPVKVWNHHTADFTGKGPGNITSVTVPAKDFIIMDRNDADLFMSIPSPMHDSMGQVTPKALTYCCSICCPCDKPNDDHSTPYPNHLHVCFREQLQRFNLLSEPDICNRCGDAIHEDGGMEAHFKVRHPNIPYGANAVAVGGSSSVEVAALQGQVALLTQMLSGLLGNAGLPKTSATNAAGAIVVSDVEGPPEAAPEPEPEPTKKNHRK